MTKDQIAGLLERIAAWPEEAQGELIERMIEIETKYTGVYRLDDEERADIREALQELERGEVASDEEVEAVFSKYRA